MHFNSHPCHLSLSLLNSHFKSTLLSVILQHRPSSLLLRLLQAVDQPPGKPLPVDMQSTSLSNQYLWKVVTNGPQGGESTLNTYKASAGILQVRAVVGMSQVVSLHSSPPRQCNVSRKRKYSLFIYLLWSCWIFLNECTHHRFIYWAWGLCSKSATCTNL